VEPVGTRLEHGHAFYESSDKGVPRVLDGHGPGGMLHFQRDFDALPLVSLYLAPEVFHAAFSAGTGAALVVADAYGGCVLLHVLFLRLILSEVSALTCIASSKKNRVESNAENPDDGIHLTGVLVGKRLKCLHIAHLHIAGPVGGY
jgi:hypothetical protein